VLGLGFLKIKKHPTVAIPKTGEGVGDGDVGPDVFIRRIRRQARVLAKLSMFG
jgi:hypothetical protein